MDTVHLRGGGVSLLLDAAGPGLPRVVHWGGDLGSDVAGVLEAATAPLARASFDVRLPLALLPKYRGRPGLTGDRPVSFVVEAVDASDDAVRVSAHGDGLALESELALDHSGVLRMRHSLRNEGTVPYTLAELACVLPVPAVTAEVLDLTGRWCRERHPQRRAFDQGTWLRQTRHGRTGFDAPLLLVAGTPGFGFRDGEVWGVHLGWSGNASWWAERMPDGASTLGAAELLEPGEVVLAPGEDYAAPWLYAAWSDRGLDGLSAALHRFIRARPSHPVRPRPVVLNTWEAVYFDHRLDRLSALADTAAELGVERFVLDDGWFRHRRDDTAGLGDWYVAEDVWPDGLHPLVESRPRPRHGVRPVGRAGDGEPGLRPRSRTSGVGARGAAVAQPAGARHRAPGRLRVPARAPRRARLRVRDRLPQVGPQPRRRGRRARADAGRVPAARRAARPPSRPRDRELLVWRLTRRSRDPRAH